MKKLFISSTLVLASAMAMASDTLLVKTTIHCNHCLACGSCGERINREFPFIKGLTDYVFDPKAMTFRVSYNPKSTNPDAIRLAISKIGYDADNVPADPRALAKFDGCCLK